MFLMFFGFTVFAAGMIFVTIQGCPVAIEKLDGQYMWLKGPGKSISPASGMDQQMIAA